MYRAARPVDDFNPSHEYVSTQRADLVFFRHISEMDTSDTTFQRQLDVGPVEPFDAGYYNYEMTQEDPTFYPNDLNYESPFFQ